MQLHFIYACLVRQNASCGSLLQTCMKYMKALTSALQQDNKFMFCIVATTLLESIYLCSQIKNWLNYNMLNAKLNNMSYTVHLKNVGLGISGF